MKFILTYECPQVTIVNVTRNVCDAYDRWIPASEQERIYILAKHITNVLTEKLESMTTTYELMDVWNERFIQVLYNSCMNLKPKQHLKDENKTLTNRKKRLNFILKNYGLGYGIQRDHISNTKRLTR